MVLLSWAKPNVLTYSADTFLPWANNHSRNTLASGVVIFGYCPVQNSTL